ncbi:MAG: alpha/beta hydrolase [Clostridium sp.]|jgi:pimeloyl-ACP methyl ester carboxylesterase/uncharacterized membrane protein (DUF485 family)|nr:alpha/beta hydrolase [Clostridium sp.]
MKKKLKRKNREFLLLLFVVILIFSMYQFLLRPILKKSMATEVIGTGITFILLASVLITFLLVVLLCGYIFSFKVNRKKYARRLVHYRKKSIIAALISIMLLAGYTYYSQKNAYIKPLCNEYNDIIPTSISDLEKIELNGNEQWISFKGIDKSNPVLLVIGDGPGKSEMARFNKSLEALQDDFVIVNWDELGTGKSAKSVDELTIDNYVSDGIELTKYLCQKFNKQKIYVFGNSFGSTLGILMIKNSPNLYEGFIGTSSVVSVKRNEEYRYNRAVEIAEGIEDEATLRKLKAQGEPGYDKNMYKKQKIYYDYLKMKENEDKKIDGNGYNSLNDIFSSEYGLLDKYNKIFAEKKIYDKIFKSYYDVDLISSARELKVPVYFLQGNRDYLSSSELLNEYFSVLNAPDKQIIWLEKSGSMPWISEKEEFMKNIKKKLLNK